MPEGLQPRGVTPLPRSGAVAKSARLRWRRNSREELPRVRGQGGRPRRDTQRPRSGAAAGRSYPHAPTPEARGGDERSYHASKVRGSGRVSMPEARGGGLEEQPTQEARVGVQTKSFLAPPQPPVISWY